MRLSSRRGDDADLIRARLRALLDEGRRRPGWLPDEAEGDDDRLPAVEADPAGWREEAGGATDPPSDTGRHRAPGSAVRLDPGRRGAWSLWAVGLLAALAVAATTWFQRPQVQPAPPERAAPSAPAVTGDAPATPSVGVAADTASTVVVSVVGQVVRPGLVTVPEGSRVADAITAAGGLLPDADPGSVNLAAVVADGEQVAVGVPGSQPGGAASGSASGPAAGAGGVDLNTATAADLDALPGIGSVLAQRIVDHREQNGRFTSVEQLDDVPGIGPSTYAELADLVTV